MAKLARVYSLKSCVPRQSRLKTISLRLGDDNAAGHRPVQLVQKYGAGLGLAVTRGGPAPDLGSAVLSSPVPGTCDFDALEVATTLKIPHHTDVPTTRAILERGRNERI